MCGYCKRTTAVAHGSKKRHASGGKSAKAREITGRPAARRQSEVSPKVGVMRDGFVSYSGRVRLMRSPYKRNQISSSYGGRSEKRWQISSTHA